MNLKIGGNSVGKIMFNGQEFGGATKLEPGTIFYVSNSLEYTIKNLHLPSTTKKWENINGIKIAEASSNDITTHFDEVNISGDDFKNLNVEKKYKLDDKTVTVSRSTVDGEYRLNISGYNPSYSLVVIAI